MSKLSLLDLGFFVAETQASPKHVAGLLICRRPPKSTPAFAKNLYKEYLTFTDVKAPFNQCIDFSLKPLPDWKTVDVDLSQHIFFHTLPKDNCDRKGLYAFVSTLHTPMLNRSRPLWEMHVIDGMDDGRFAIYQRMHHAYADGVTMSSWMADSFAATADDLELLPIWTLARGRHASRRAKLNQELLSKVWRELTGNSRRFLGVGRLAAMLFLESVRLTKNAIALPFVSSAKTPLTGQVTAGRQFASASVSMKRIGIKSADPREAPVIDPQFLSDERDLQLLIKGGQAQQRLMESNAFDSVRGKMLYPVDINDAKAMEQDIRNRADTQYHPVGTCKMGPASDPMAVVDAQLRVKGISGLRVADASIMPTLIGGNTNAPSIMIGEKCAELIRNGH